MRIIQRIFVPKFLRTIIFFISKSSTEPKKHIKWIENFNHPYLNMIIKAETLRFRKKI